MRSSGQGGSSQDPTAQTSTARWSLGLAAGPAFPVGAFHNIAYASPTAGYARTGYGAELSGNYRLYHTLGITLAAGFQDNPGATTRLYPLDPAPLGEPASTMTRKHWNMARLLAGPSWSMPLLPKKGLSLRFRALAGALKTKIPDVTTYSPGLPNTVSAGITDYHTYGPLPWAFAYQADAGLQWHVTHRLALSLDAGYEGSRCNATYRTADYYSDLPPISGAHTFPAQIVRMSSTVVTGALYTRLGIGIGF
jgi:opacity protein-like surface antigen